MINIRSKYYFFCLLSHKIPNVCCGSTPEAMSKSMTKAAALAVITSPARPLRALHQKKMVYGVDVYATPKGLSSGGGGGGFVSAHHDHEMLRRDVVSSSSRSDARSQTAASCASIAMLQQLTGGGGGGGGSLWSEVSAGLTDLSSLPVSDPHDPRRHPANAALEGVLRTAALEYHDVVRCSNVHDDSRRVGQLRVSGATGGASADDGAVRGNVVSRPLLHAMSSHPALRGGPDVDGDSDGRGVATMRDAIRDIITRPADLASSHRLLLREAAIVGIRTGATPASGETRLSTAAAAASRPTVFVTGGLGAIGLEVALWLVERNAGSRVCLSGRTGRAGSEGQRSLRRLCGGSADGGVITVFRCDAAIQEECRQSAQDMRWPGGGKFLEGVTGVVHASGVLADAMVPRQRAGGIRIVMAPKVAAASRLEAHVFGGGFNPVAASVMFSSVAALFGSPGQIGYSGANCAVDAAAISFRRGGHPVSSLQWGAWGSGGMAAKDAAVLARIERQGIGVLSPERGLAVLGAVLGSFAGVGVLGGAPPSHLSQLVPARNLAASPFDWARIAQHVRPLPPVCEEVCAEECVSVGSSSAAAAAVSSRGGVKVVEDATAATAEGKGSAMETAAPRLGDIREVITRATVDLTGNKEISPHEPLMSAGLDSLAGMGRAERLSLTNAFTPSCFYLTPIPWM
jgi:hypothetical protein